MKLRYVFLCLCILASLSTSSSAHSGNTDEDGGHNSATGYHYHHGYPAHEHIDGICPYDFDDKTGVNSGASSSSTAPTEESDDQVGFLSLYGHILIIIGGILFAVIVICAIVSSRRAKREAEQWAQQEAELQAKQQAKLEVEQEQARRQAEQRAKKFEAERVHYQSLYGGKSISELVVIPEGDSLNDVGLPIALNSVDRDVPYGTAYTFYRSGGNRYHRVCGCSGSHTPINAAKIDPDKLFPCLRCSPTLPDLSWYREYLSIQEIKSKYGIE